MLKPAWLLGLRDLDQWVVTPGMDSGTVDFPISFGKNNPRIAVTGIVADNYTQAYYMVVNKTTPSSFNIVSSSTFGYSKYVIAIGGW